MKLQKPSARVFVPDGAPLSEALSRTTVLCVAAHQDDIEIMAYGHISQCFDADDRWFTGVTVTDGAGSPRAGAFASMTDEQMRAVRADEQDRAAALGRYAAMAQLAWPSSAVRSAEKELEDELLELITRCSPETVLTHNLADKHDTHVGVALRVIGALRRLPGGARPRQLLGLEVWRGLDWLCDDQKRLIDTSARPELAEALVSVFESQCAGGKRYDLAALGRRRANATFYASHTVDPMASCAYGMDLTPLLRDDALEPLQLVRAQLAAFSGDVEQRISALTVPVKEPRVL